MESNLEYKLPCTVGYGSEKTTWTLCHFNVVLWWVFLYGLSTGTLSLTWPYWSCVSLLWNQFLRLENLVAISIFFST